MPCAGLRQRVFVQARGRRRAPWRCIRPRDHRCSGASPRGAPCRPPCPSAPRRDRRRARRDAAPLPIRPLAEGMGLQAPPLPCLLAGRVWAAARDAEIRVGQAVGDLCIRTTTSPCCPARSATTPGPAARRRGCRRTCGDNSTLMGVRAPERPKRRFVGVEKRSTGPSPAGAASPWRAAGRYGPICWKEVIARAAASAASRHCSGGCQHRRHLVVGLPHRHACFQQLLAVPVRLGHQLHAVAGHLEEGITPVISARPAPPSPAGRPPARPGRRVESLGPRWR